MNSRPIAIDLFAGAGGLSLGLEQAGFDVAAAVEIDPIHACAHEFNFPKAKLIARGVEHVTAELLWKELDLRRGDEVELVAGGAPCQGFSLIGQRALDDPRNRLVAEFVRIVGEVKPNYFLFENVKGLTVGKHKRFLAELIESLERQGYAVLQPWRVLNAKDYGVPQSRERLFLIGAREGLPLPEYPEPTRPQPVTVEEALGDLPDAEAYEELLNSDECRFRYSARPKGYAATMRCAIPSAWHYGYRREWDRGLLTSSMRTNHTEMSRDRFRATEGGNVEPISRFFKLAPDGVSNTLRAGTDSARGAFTSPRPIHYKHPRCVTVREMARLHGFPDWFRFHATKWHGARQIGNAVPPPLAYAIGRAIQCAAGRAGERPQEVLRLGDPALLKMDMTTASKYWGVQNPIAKRNRKSGAKKRRQQEIFTQVGAG